ncbi:MAG: hypothetical protein ACU0A6_00815 [Shimia sp.]|uniref:hypothetical protein n=1 Tax=Shimia sp. TaxID=1954381 RepID=UPI004059AE58
MLKHIFAALTALSSAALPAQAITADAFRALIQAGDYENAAGYIAETDASVSGGSGATYDDLRKLFGVFETTHPDVVATLNAWGQSGVTPLYQQVALGWHHSHLGWIARGERTARHTHPSAFDASRRHQAKVSDLALPLFEQRQDFMPLNDLMVATLKQTSDLETILTFADRALPASPDVSLLRRVRSAAAPKWKGSWDAVSYVCDTWIGVIDAPDGFTLDVCIVEEMTASGAIHEPSLRPALDQLFQDTAPPLLDRTRVALWQNEPAFRQDWIDATYRSFNPHRHDALGLLSMMVHTYDAPEFLEFLNEVDGIKNARLRNDPLHPRSVNQFLNNNFDITTDTYAPGTENAYRQMLLDMLPYARYQPQTWQLMAQYTRQHHSLPDALNTVATGMVPEEIPFWEKSIVASNYAIDDLAFFYELLAEILYETYRQENIKSEFPFTDRMMDFEDLPQSDQIALAPIADLRTPYLCPFVKTQYLLKKACQTAKRGDALRCQNTLGFYDHAEDYMARRLASNPSCKGFEIWKMVSGKFDQDLYAPITLPMPKEPKG